MVESLGGVELLKSHLRPVLEHRRQVGLSSPHLTRRILRQAQHETLSIKRRLTPTCKFCILALTSEALLSGLNEETYL